MTYGTMIDCTGEKIPALLVALGSNNPDTFASYATGTGGVPATDAEFTELSFRAGVFRYDQSPELQTFAAGLADCADIEASAGTIDNAVAATKEREAKHWYSWWYFSAANLSQARSYVAANSFQRVRFVVANWNLSETEAEQFIADNEDVDAVQWASPSSNPTTVCPGTSRTLSALNVDLNVTRSGWFIKPSNPVVPVPKFKGIVITSALDSVAVTSNDGKTWSAS